MKYNPEPIDISKVELSKKILKLTETLARNTHDTWARKRMIEGWTYGPERNDKRRQHPCLVPYEELPDSEKEYDRRIAIQTLKVVIALGYRINETE